MCRTSKRAPSHSHSERESETSAHGWSLLGGQASATVVVPAADNVFERGEMSVAFGALEASRR